MRPGITKDLFRFMTFRCRSVCNLLMAFLTFLGVFASGCRSTPTPDQAKGSPPSDWIKWRQKRHESIAGTNGWTTLISLHWLPEGRTFAGADPTNQLVLPPGRAPAVAGDFFRSGNSVRFEAAPEVIATADGAPARELELKTDASDNPSRLMIGPLSFVVIDRGGRLGVRVRDPESPARLQFAGLRYFPYNSSWRIEGRFEAFSSPRTLRVPDASGGIQELSAPGALVFPCAGREYRLDAVDEGGGGDYFVIFTDRTAGASTYAAGRFLYVARPDAAGRVIIDFNRAFTPPCGFTPFATCPRPLPQNWLPFAIKAGERKPAETH
jgi:uncharacterized protein